MEKSFVYERSVNCEKPYSIGKHWNIDSIEVHFYHVCTQTCPNCDPLAAMKSLDTYVLGEPRGRMRLCICICIIASIAIHKGYLHS